MPTKNKLLLLQITIVFLSLSAAYQPCSSLQSFSNKSPHHLQELSKGCTLESNDEFSIELPLMTHNKLSQLHLDLTNTNDNFHINLTPEDNIYELELIYPETREIYTIPASTRSLQLSINKGTCTISISDSPITLSRALIDAFPYILSIQLPNEEVISQGDSTINKATSFRMLNQQCDKGFFLVEGTCQRTCPAKQYDHNGACTRCPDTCLTGRCISEMMCNPCKANEVFSKEQGKCLDKCPDSYFEDYNNRICVKCAEGCVSCSFPNGLCSESYFKNDMIINMAVSIVLLSLITLCACCCNKEKNDDKKTTEEQQVQQSQETTKSKTKGTSEHIKQIAGIDPKAPYVVLPEAFSFENENEEEAEGSDKMIRRKRLNQFAENKLLTLSVQKKGFMIDDADEEKAISHGSGSQLNVPKLSSTLSYNSKASSPLFISKTKRRSSKTTQRSYGELVSPNTANGLIAGKQTSLGMIINRDSSNVDAVTFLDALDEEQEHEQIDTKENRQLQPLKIPLQLPDFDKSTRTVEEAGELEELEDMEEKEGYKNDSSLNMSRDKEGTNDMYACTICGMNKRDCLNRPCGHMVGCHACMEQFKEKYGVCPRCKKQLVSLEKVVKK